MEWKDGWTDQEKKSRDTEEGVKGLGEQREGEGDRAREKERKG